MARNTFYTHSTTQDDLHFPIKTLAENFMDRGLRKVAVAAFSALVVVCTLGFLARPSAAADPAIINRGDAVFTGFSGTKTDKVVPPNVHPLDRTFIDVNGPAAQVFDLSKLGVGPRGQLADTPSKLQIKAADTGQVFGVTLDDGQGTNAPNAYLSSTSLYGLNIVNKSADGKFERLIKGAPDAEWMAGQFGVSKGGSPGSIWKVDGRTGAVSLFATIKLEGLENGGAGLGNITFDSRTKQFFVSDLQTGMIHRVTLDGKERDIYDHGVAGRKSQGLDPVAFDDTKILDIKKPLFNSEDPKTWGYTDERRRVFGLAVNAGRLYYSVAEGPSVWSVSIDDEGDFGGDPRIEIDVKNEKSAITDILFDGSGLLYLSQRGASAGSYDYTKFATPQQAAVLRYKWDEKQSRWLETADEYAIGLPKDYRGTQGGIASNYGYDKYGNIDYGKCRQTLWSTGEHLREGTDLVRVSNGGARIVHGLQGNYKSQVRPANEPPFQTWFTDYDNQFSDQDAFGHIGDVAIYSPCDAVNERPYRGYDARADYDDYAPRLIYEEPPVDRPDLILNKTCVPGAIGSKIRCTITVTNTGSEIPIEDVSVRDVTKIMFGPASGTVVPIDGFVPANPDVRCDNVPTTDFGCQIPSQLLPPGASTGFDVFIDTRDLASNGNLGFRNCASMNHPNGWGRACAEGGTDIVVEKTGPVSCLPGGTCKFGLKIINASSLPFDGDLMLADAMFVSGSVTGAPVTSVSPPIACIAGNTTQLPFTCVTHTALMPGEVQTHFIDVTMPAPGGFFVENCFGALDPALASVGGVPGLLTSEPGDDGPGNPSCVIVEVPVPSPDLSIEKTALNGGICEKSPAGDLLTCSYEIAITNHDEVPFSGPVDISENLPAGAAIATVIPAPWTCSNAPPATCSTGGAITIQAGGSTALQVQLQISVLDTEASFCQVPITVQIRAPIGGAPNVDPDNDEATATASTFGVTFVDPVTNITMVMCDPTNLKVQKTAKGPCTKAGDGFTCEYDVTITNTGPDPYQGPVRLDEKFGTTPTNVTFNGDLTCAGAGADFKCEKPIATMAKGTSLKLNVKATIPDDGTCAAPNTAKMTFPPVGSKGNGRGDDDSASATANVPSERCNKPVQLISTPPAVVSKCPDGLPIPRSGRCPCADGGRWNASTNSCSNGEQPEAPRGCKPGVHEVKTDDGRCICREGYSKEDGNCVKDEDEPKQPPKPQACGDNEYRSDSGRCTCDDGYERNGGRCVKERPVPQGCTPGAHEYKTPTGRCACDDGYERSENGRCVRESNPEQDCKNAGRLWTGTRCKDRPDPGAECRENGGRYVEGDCVMPPKRRPCPNGYDGDYQPNCKLIKPKGPTAEEICENRGGRYIEGDCVFKKREPVGCGPGFYSDNGKCRRIVVEPPVRQRPPVFVPKPRPPVYVPKPPVFVPKPRPPVYVPKAPVYVPKAPVFVPKPKLPVFNDTRVFKPKPQAPVLNENKLFKPKQTTPIIKNFNNFKLLKPKPAPGPN